MLTVKVRTSLKAKQICTKVQKMKRRNLSPQKKKENKREIRLWQDIMCHQITRKQPDIIQTGVTKYDAIMIL
jgi:hypothetical protein